MKSRLQIFLSGEVIDYQWLCAKPVKSAPAAQGPRNTMMCGLILLLILLICQAEAQGQHFYRKKTLLHL